MATKLENPVPSNVAPSDVSTSSSAGVQQSYSRADHTHEHGALPSKTETHLLHSLVTRQSPGFMGPSDKARLDDLSKVAVSGSYTDLSNKPTLAPVASSGTYNDLIDKPKLSTIATTGSYTDLKDKPKFATVAQTGSFRDLRDVPEYPIASYWIPTPVSPNMSNRGDSIQFSRADHSHFHGWLPSVVHYKPLHEPATDESPGFMTAADKKKLDSLSPVGSLIPVVIGSELHIAGCLLGTVLKGRLVSKYLISHNVELRELMGAGPPVTLYLDGIEVQFPQAAQVGQVLSAVVTGAGKDCVFTVIGVLL